MAAALAGTIAMPYNGSASVASSVGVAPAHQLMFDRLPSVAARSILVEDATVRLSLNAPLTPLRGPARGPHWPPARYSCRPSSSSWPWTRGTSSAA